MKPSPVPSILLFIATAALAFSLFGRGWSVHEDENISVHTGPVWGEVCFDSGDGMQCETHTFLSDLGKGSMGVQRILSLVFVLLGISGTILAGIAGLLLLSRPRSATALVTVILLGGAMLITLGTFLYAMSKGGRMGGLPGYGFFLFLVGAILAIVGGFLGMSSKRGGGAPMRPGYPMGPPGYGPPGYPPQGYPGGPPGYPPQGAAPGYPQQGGAPGYPSSQQSGPPPGYPQPHAQQPMAAPDGAQAPQAPQQAQAPQQSPAHPTCGTPMTWAAQYGRWFCPRCNQYG